MKPKLILLLSLFLGIKTFAQIPIGENINQASIEIKNLMKENGFTFFQKQTSNEVVKFLYKEEVSVLLNTNEYGNVVSVVYYCNNADGIAKIHKFLNQDNWKYAGNGIEYYYKGYDIVETTSLSTEDKYEIIIHKK